MGENNYGENESITGKYSWGEIVGHLREIHEDETVESKPPYPPVAFVEMPAGDGEQVKMVKVYLKLARAVEA